MNISISAKNLTHKYGELTAVDHVSFDVKEGEIFGFLGPNGAGKTTVVRLLTGQLRPGEGQVIVLGKDMSKSPKDVQANLGVSFETTNLYEKMNAVENLQLFARLFGIRKFYPMPLLERVGLSGREKEKVESYSKGMKQRLMLARALVNQPRILFLDEPTDGLDPVSAKTIHSIIQKAASEGTSVFLTTHDMAEADKLSHRVAFINQGRIEAMDQPSVLKRNHGKRVLSVEYELPSGQIETKAVELDGGGSEVSITELFAHNKILTAHTEEATLEDIFIEITGRGLLG